MEERADEDFEIQEMRQILTQGFDDTDVDAGAVEYIVPEDCLLLRNREYARTNKKAKKFNLRKWIKSLVHR